MTLTGEDVLFFYCYDWKAEQLNIDWDTYTVYSNLWHSLQVYAER